MTWLYAPGCFLSVRGSEELISDSGLPPGAVLWVTLSGTPVQRDSSWHGWKIRPWILRLSGTISRPSTAERLAEAWTSSLRASRASRTRTPGSSFTVRTTATSSRSSLASWAKWSPESSSWKKSQGSLFETDSDECSGTWPRSGSMRSGTVSRQPESEPRTSVVGCSFSRGEYPTPSATPYGSSQNEGEVEHKRPTNGTPSLESWVRGAAFPGSEDRPEAGETPGLIDDEDASMRRPRAWPTPRALSGGPESAERKQELGRTASGGGDLQSAAMTWATPTTAAANGFTRDPEKRSAQRKKARKGHDGNELGRQAIRWPTPTKGDEKASGSRNAEGSKANDGISLTDAVKTGSSHSGRTGLATTAGEACPPRLSPAFVAWLMGFPRGWVSATRFDTSGTPWSLWWSRMRSELSRLAPGSDSALDIPHAWSLRPDDAQRELREENSA